MSHAPAPPLVCPMCSSTMVHQIVAHGQPALECSQCNHWGTLDWGFEQSGARAARLGASVNAWLAKGPLQDKLVTAVTVYFVDGTAQRIDR